MNNDLLQAVKDGNEIQVRQLLEYNVDSIHIRNEIQETALIVAAKNG
jgi:ankyrin repeat protein